MNGRAAGAGATKAGRGSPPPHMSMCGLLSIQFYQPYFDVNTDEVKARLLQAAWPLRKRSSTFLSEGGSSQQADLYGPVWVREADRIAQHAVVDKRAKQPIPLCSRRYRLAFFGEPSLMRVRMRVPSTTAPCPEGSQLLLQMFPQRLLPSIFLRQTRAGYSSAKPSGSAPGFVHPNQVGVHRMVKLGAYKHM